jgi:hypothetical protein
MPDARCTRGLVCKWVEKTHTSIQGSGGDPTFPAQWLYGLCRDLPGDEFVLSPSSADMDCPSPVGPTRLRRLDTSNGCQNHTVLPYAAAVFAKRLRRALRRSSARRSPLTGLSPTRPATTSRAQRRRVHRIPSQRSVTMANAPSSGTGCRTPRGDLPDALSEILPVGLFCRTQSSSTTTAASRWALKLRVRARTGFAAAKRGLAR